MEKEIKNIGLISASLDIIAYIVCSSFSRLYPEDPGETRDSQWKKFREKWKTLFLSHLDAAYKQSSNNKSLQQLTDEINSAQ